MADGIFTDEELKAQEQQPGAEEQQQQPPEGETEQQKADRERDEQGRFKAKEPVEGAEGEGEDGKQKTVPQEALHAERKKRQAIEGELTKVKEQLDALAKMREQIAARKPAEMPAADDPAAIEHLRNRLAELEQSTTRVTQHIDEQAVNSAEMQQLGAFVSEAEASYRAEKPDYDAAIAHVVQARANELRLYGLNPAQIAATISEEATEIARAAIAQNRNPAELGYQIALSRGYRPQQKQEGGEEQGKVNGTSAAQRTLDAIAEAKKQGKSLGGAGGGKAPILNAEAVLAMSPEEFDAIYSTPEGKAMIDSL